MAIGFFGKLCGGYANLKDLVHIASFRSNGRAWRGCELPVVWDGEAGSLGCMGEGAVVAEAGVGDVVSGAS